MLRIFTENSTWDKPIELQLRFPSSEPENHLKDLENFGRNDIHVPTFHFDEFFNPIPPPSLNNLSQGLNKNILSSNKTVISFG